MCRPLPCLSAFLSLAVCQRKSLRPGLRPDLTRRLRLSARRALPLAIAAALAFAPADAGADAVIDRVLDGLILPAAAGFATAADRLRDAATADCTAQGTDLRDAWNAAFDAWLALSPYRFGPVEVDGRGLAIAFWPDPKDARGKALRGLIAAGRPPADYATASVAARGLFAVEALLYDPAFNAYGPADPGCALMRAATADLAETAAAIDAGWADGFADSLRRAGEPGNTRYLTAAEARQALFTAALTGWEFDADTRLGRPLGTFDRPRPARAEARASGRAVRNLALSLAATDALARALGADQTETMPDALRYTETAIARLRDDPLLAGVDTPTGRLRIQDAQDAIRRSRDAAVAELGSALGVSPGFNSLDGD